MIPKDVCCGCLVARGEGGQQQSALAAWRSVTGAVVRAVGAVILRGDEGMDESISRVQLGRAACPGRDLRKAEVESLGEKKMVGTEAVGSGERTGLGGRAKNCSGMHLSSGSGGLLMSQMR